MGAFFGAIVSWLLSRLFGKTPAPSQEVVQASKAAVAETKLSTEAQAAAVQSAVAQAVTDAPKDVAGTEQALRGGTF